MPINMTSTTDSDEAVTAALGDLAQPTEEVETPAPEAEAPESETAGESGTPEEEEIQPEGAEEGEEEDDEALAAKEGDKPKKKTSGWEKRVKKLTKRNSEKDQIIHAKDRRIVELEEALRAVNKDQVTTQKPAIQASGEKPKPSDFENHDDYIEALTDYKVAESLKARTAKEQEAKVKTELQLRMEAHQQRVSKFSNEHDDFQEVINDVKVPLSMTVQEAILDSEHGPELMYELAKNEDELKRICSLPAHRAAMEMGKLEAKFSKSQTPAQPSEKPTTKAPKPVTPIRGQGTVAAKSIDDPDISQAEYERLRLEQIRKRRNA